MRRKSMKSMSEVRVRRTVMVKDRPLFFFALKLEPLDGSTNKPHSIIRSISTGFWPPLEVISTSVVFKKYCGSSDTEASSSKPKGLRRFRSCKSYQLIHQNGIQQCVPSRSLKSPASEAYLRSWYRALQEPVSQDALAFITLNRAMWPWGYIIKRLMSYFAHYSSRRTIFLRSVQFAVKQLRICR